MAITVKHTKVSTIPDGDDTSVVRPSDWNADHQLTGTIPVENGGTGASTLTGYVYGNGTSAMTAATTIPNTSITGLGTASTKDAGVANGVATLDSGGKVPVSELPAAVLGALSYQGTWNASTNTPTLTSSVGTKGYYYVVSVAGSTNLNGITDWVVGDWAVYNGSAWQKIDNTDAVTSVNGYTGTVVLNYTDVGAFPATATTGTGSVVLQTSPTINTPTLSGATVDGAAAYMNYTPTTAPSYVEGRVFYDSTAKTLCYYNDNSQMTVNIGQEEIVRVRNQTGATIPNGSVVYINGATGNTPTIALALANNFSTSDIIGVTTTDITNNGFGYATINGLVNGLDTSAFVEGDAVFLSATTAGAFTTTEPTRPNYSIQVGVILRANPSVGTLLVSVQIVSTETQHIIGTVAVDQGGTGQTSYTNGQLLIGNTTGNTLTKSTLTAGTGVSVTNGTGSITLANTGVTSAVAGTGISVSGSTGAVTVTNTAPDQTVALTAGTGISTSGTYPNFTITNTAPSSGGTVTSITAGTGLSGGTITSSGTIAIDSTVATLTGVQTLTNKTISGASNTLSNIGNSSLTNSAITINGTSTSLGGSISVGTVTSVTGTAPVVSSGGNTPAISMPAATTSVSGYLTSTDWNTFNNKGSGTVTSVTGTAPVVSSGGATPAISMAAATGSVNGYLTSTDWTTFNSKSPAAGSSSITTTGTVTSGTWSGSFGSVSGANLTTLNASNLSSGTVATARLASGTANSTTFLRGDSTWATVAASPAGSNTQIQYNSSGSFAGSANLTFDGTNLSFNSGYGSAAVAYGCRAWVNFNGTGTIAIRGSGNVSSITDHAAGEYGINLTTALVDTNYASLAVAGGQEGGITEIPRRSTTPTTSNVRVIYNNGNSDSLYMSVSLYR